MLKKKVNSLNEFKNFINKNKNSVYLIGPGSGVSKITMQKTSYLLKNVKYVVIDADALTSFKGKTNRLQLERPAPEHSPVLASVHSPVLASSQPRRAAAGNITPASR